jgi:hypothetical protein
MELLPYNQRKNRLSSEMPAVHPWLQAKLAGQIPVLSPVSQSRLTAKVDT